MQLQPAAYLREEFFSSKWIFGADRRAPRVLDLRQQCHCAATPSAAAAAAAAALHHVTSHANRFKYLLFQLEICQTAE